MTRKDYILLADVLRVQHNRETNNGKADADYRAATAVYDVAQEIADALHSDNPRFDREHFLAVVRGEKDINSRPARR